MAEWFVLIFITFVQAQANKLQQALVIIRAF
jgi:hypothetical protein